ncbi:MAG TPA: 2-isopropylmalate synthase [Rhizomicrobium sp.]|jgi:2-isopropylmalate synthase|nr:2-isopropylmalate synthase [Rhizomicrobium sp.]
MRSVDDNRVIVFDTTLRDGEQAPGFSMGIPEKLRVAAALRDLGVDVIEAGFASASPGDEAAIRAIGEAIEGPTICSLARANIADIEASMRALETAKDRRIHVFLATSPIHRKAKLNMSCAEVLEAIDRSVRFARTFCDDVEFSAEDAIRTEQDFLIEALQVAADAGASTLNIPDTVGYSTPEEIGALFRLIGARVRRGKHVRLSAHCHDDLGMAVANSLAAVQGGARQVECTINGIGERAGNCALEEFVMALKTRADLFEMQTGIDTTKLAPVSRLVSRVTTSPIVRNKAVVGRNAFAHEAGIHQHGMMKDARTYEVMRPEDVGMSASQMVLGKHSGRHAVAKRARELGFEVGDNAMADVFAAFKARADEIGALDDEEMRAVLGGDASEQGWSLTRLEARTEKTGKSHAAVVVELAQGDGPAATHVAIGETALEAAFLAVRQAAGADAEVDEIEILQAGYGANSDAQAEAMVRIGDKSWCGHGRGPDPLWAGVRAFVDAFNKAARTVKQDDAVQESFNEAAG